MANASINVPAAIDIGLVGIVGGTFLHVLPPVAAVLAILYYMIQIYESPTIQTWLRRHNQRHAVRRLRRLEAKQRIILAEIAATELMRKASLLAAETKEVAKTEAATLVAQTIPLPPTDPMG